MHVTLIMIHLYRAKAKCQVKQGIWSFALWAEKREARSKLRGERGGSRTQQVGPEQCRAADKILKGRCGCSNGLINSRKFPLNPVCWGSEHGVSG